MSIRQLLSVCLAVPSVLSAVGAHAATAYAEQSNMTGTGKVVHLYRLPTTDASNNVQYFDVTITLPIRSDGLVGTSATVTSVATPNYASNKFVSGRYTTGWYGTMTCNQTVSPAASGRQTGSLSCQGGSGYSDRLFSASWATGPLAGHPDYSNLVASGLDKVGDFQDLGYGTSTANGLGYFGCFGSSDNVSAVQSGAGLSLTSYGSTGTTAKCTVTFYLQQ